MGKEKTLPPPDVSRAKRMPIMDPSILLKAYFVASSIQVEEIRSIGILIPQSVPTCLRQSPRQPN